MQINISKVTASIHRVLLSVMMLGTLTLSSQTSWGVVGTSYPLEFANFQSSAEDGGDEEEEEEEEEEEPDCD